MLEAAQAGIPGSICFLFRLDPATVDAVDVPLRPLAKQQLQPTEC